MVISLYINHSKPPLWMFCLFCDKNGGNLSYLHACSCGIDALRKQMNEQVYWCEEVVHQGNMLAIFQTCFQPLCYIRTLLCIARFWPFLINLFTSFPVYTSNVQVYLNFELVQHQIFIPHFSCFADNYCVFG